MKGGFPLLPLAAVLAATTLGAGVAWYRSNTMLGETRNALLEATTTVSVLEAKLREAENENTQLADALAAEQKRNDAFEEKINDISGTVGKLDKLAKTDPELLQKYSKIYFLNENYIPTELVQIPQEWTYGGQEEYFHAKLWDELKELLEDARNDGIELRIISGYRAFEMQAQLKAAYTVRYGSGANAFSADQGYSEHQLGTTIDFTTEGLGSGFTAFGDTDAFKWLLDHAHEYGFILSYPEGNRFYIYEPWHWRYVGKKLAEDLHDDDITFYELDQRTIDEYLIDFF